MQKLACGAVGVIVGAVMMLCVHAFVVNSSNHNYPFVGFNQIKDLEPEFIEITTTAELMDKSEFVESKGGTVLLHTYSDLHLTTAVDDISAWREGIWYDIKLYLKLDNVNVPGKYYISNMDITHKTIRETEGGVVIYGR